MRIKITLSVFIIIILTNALISQNFSYFPLSSGNIWYFKEYDGYIYTILMCTQDTVLDDGKNYTQIDKYDRGGNFTSPDTFQLTKKGYAYLRQEGNFIVEFPEQVIFDFYLSVGDSVISFFEDPYPAVLDTVYIENVFGRNLSTYLFYFTAYDHYSYTDSVGFNILWASTWQNWEPRYLAGCIIDGVEYGETATFVINKNFILQKK